MPISDHEPSNKIESELTRIEWSKGKFEENKYMPTFNIDVNVSDIAKYDLQFILWRIVPTKTHNEDEAIFFADTHISFWKLFEKEYTSSELNVGQLQQVDVSQERKAARVKMEERSITRTEKLRFGEEIIGEIKIFLTLKNHSYFKQSKYNTRTESGIVNIIPSFRNHQNWNAKSSNKHIVEICEFNETLDELMGKSLHNPLKRAEYEGKIREELVKINKKIKENHHDSLIILDIQQR